MIVRTAEFACQAGAPHLGDCFIDASIQVVEADITRKQMRRGGGGGRSRAAGADSQVATPKPPSAPKGGEASTATVPQPALELPSSALSAITFPTEGDGSLWGNPDTDDQQVSAFTRLLPPEQNTIGINTDVNLTGFDVTNLSFIEAVHVRFVNGRSTAAFGPLGEAKATDSLEPLFDASVSVSTPSPRAAALAATVKPGKHHKELDLKPSAPGLPEEIAAAFGLKTADNYRPHTVAWLSALTLEVIKHVDPFKMEQQKKTLSMWTFAHFRAKYGLGKMATNYLVDFLGNLKLHHLSSLRAHFLVSWLGLREYAGLAAATPPFFSNESLYFYVYVVQSIVRTGTHKSLKEFETAELLLPPLRIEQVCDNVLRSVTASYNDMDEWLAARASWHTILLNSGELAHCGLRRLADELQNARGKPGALDLLPSTPDDVRPLPRNVSLDADVFCLLLIVNYPTLQQRMKLRAETLHTAASASTVTQVGLSEAGECVETTAPPAAMIYVQLASWPVFAELLFGDEE